MTEVAPDDLREMAAWEARHRPADGASRPYDVIAEGSTPADDPVAARSIVAAYAAAGATWWVEADGTGATIQSLRDRITAGPPAAG